MAGRELLDLAVGVAAEAIELARRMRREGVEVAATKSSPVDVVTRADRATEDLARDRLLTARPQDGFLGEEGAHLDGSSGLRWVVDPIDGTVNYVYGLGGYAVSVALVEGEQSLVGVVHTAEDEVYTAVQGEGAWRDGRPIRVRPSPPDGEWLVLTGFNYDSRVRATQGAAVARLLPRVRDIRRRGSCAVDLCSVGAGLADAYVESGCSLWDRAAGSLVATEAGASYEVLPGPHDQDLVLCAPAQGYPAFRRLVEECGFTVETPEST